MPFCAVLEEGIEGKFQAPSSNLQRSSKFQPPIPGRRNLLALNSTGGSAMRKDAQDAAIGV